MTVSVFVCVDVLVFVCACSCALALLIAKVAVLLAGLRYEMQLCAWVGKL